MTRLDTFPKELHISLWNIPIFPWKIFYLHLPSSSASRKWKNSNVVCFADPRHKVLREFSPNTTGHGLRVTKRPAVWHFSIFLFEKYQILLEIFYLYLESSSTSIKWKISNVVLFADSVHRVRRDPSVTLQKNFPSDSSGQNSKYSKETEKWRTANVFTVKQLTICSGWLLRKTISEGFQLSRNFVLQELGSRRALHQGWKWAFKKMIIWNMCRDFSQTLCVLNIKWWHLI